MSETALQFTGTDLRGLLDVLLEALNVIRRTGRRPTITVNGKLYACPSRKSYPGVAMV